MTVWNIETTHRQKFVRKCHNYAMLRYKSARDPNKNPISILDDHHLKINYVISL